MPLISSPPLGGMNDEQVEEFHDSVQLHDEKESDRPKIEEEKDSGYEDFDDKDTCLDSDMEGSVIHRPRPKKVIKTPPALPQRSERRASRILDNVLLELKNLDGTDSKEFERRSMIEEDPHELYLSSEEEASLSDDYDDDSELELELGGPKDGVEPEGSRPSSRKSQEDTARVVSFIMVGKPHIINISANSSPTSTLNRRSDYFGGVTAVISGLPAVTSKPAPHRPTPLKLYPSTSRRMSVTSVASNKTASTSASQQPLPAPAHSTSYIAPKPQPKSSGSSQGVNASPPPRKSSRLASNLSLLVSSTKSTLHHSLSAYPNQASSSALQLNHPKDQHSFLNMDPFEAAHARSPALPSPASSRHSFHQSSNPFSTSTLPPQPKTPTGTSSAWKLASSGLSRTLSKARKPSMPKLNVTYAQGIIQPQQEFSSSKGSLALTTASTVSQHDSEDQDLKDAKMYRRSATMPVLMSEQQVQQAKDNKVRYDDLMKNAVKGSSIREPNESKRGAMGALMGLGKKKSVKNATTSA